MNALYENQAREHEDLLCKVCMEYLFPPVYECMLGHSTCNNCLAKLRDAKCPMCREFIIIMIPNHYLDSVLNSTMIQCPFEHCNERIPIYKLDIHKKNCKHNDIIICPLNIVLLKDPALACIFQNNARNMIEHLNTFHGLVIKNYNKFIDWGLLNEMDGIYIQLYKKEEVIFILALFANDFQFEFYIIPLILYQKFTVEIIFKSSKIKIKQNHTILGLKSLSKSSYIILSIFQILELIEHGRLKMQINFK